MYWPCCFSYKRASNNKYLFTIIFIAIQAHVDYTNSQKAIQVLANWSEMLPKFVKVMPRDYKRVLQALREAEASGLSGDEALTAAFEANARDLARVGGS